MNWSTRIALVTIIIGTSVLGACPVSAKPKVLVHHKALHRTVRLLWPTIRSGKQEDAVKGNFSPNVAAIQYLLRGQGFYQGKPDGIFGYQTTAYVKAFQRAKGLRADGVVGSATWPKLVVPLKRGSKGDAVRAIQTIFHNMASPYGGIIYPDLNMDGVFGMETQKVVKEEQETYNSDNPDDEFAEINHSHPDLKVAGMVDMQTWCIFMGGKLR